MRSPVATFLVIAPGLLAGASYGFVLLAEWIRIVPLGNHSSVVLYHFPWRGTGIGWYPVSLSGYAWIALVNALVLFLLCMVLVIGWQATTPAWQTNGSRLIALGYAGMIAWFILRPGLW